MTTQEFVKKEKDKIVNEVFHPATDYSESKLLAKQEFGNGIITGLTKGLEIAEGLIQFALNNYFTVEALDGINYFARMSKSGSIEKLTIAELLSIYLTEINEKK